MEFPELETTRLKLTNFVEADSRSLFRLFSDDAVVEYYDLEAFTELSQAAKLISLFHSRFTAQSGIRWAIRLKNKGEFIGSCGFNSWNPKMRSSVIGYDLLPEFWGQGYITEAVYRILKEAFNGNLACGELNRVQADTVLGNEASEAVLRKVGFKEEGVRRESGYWKEQFHDLKCFGLLRSEFGEI